MFTRRALVAGAVAVTAVPFPVGSARAEPVLGDDGLYSEPWFYKSFLNYAEDVEDSTAQGKRMVLMWEQRGCPYCHETHLVNFARPDIRDYVKQHFNVVQMNVFGDREATDFDGEKLPEKKIWNKYLLRGTPSFEFFPEHAADLAAKPPSQREVLRVQGYLLPGNFKHMFMYVFEQAYRTDSFADYVRARS